MKKFAISPLMRTIREFSQLIEQEPRKDYEYDLLRALTLTWLKMFFLDKDCARALLPDLDQWIECYTPEMARSLKGGLYYGYYAHPVDSFTHAADDTKHMVPYSYYYSEKHARENAVEILGRRCIFIADKLDGYYPNRLIESSTPPIAWDDLLNTPSWIEVLP